MKEDVLAPSSIWHFSFYILSSATASVGLRSLKLAGPALQLPYTFPSNFSRYMRAKALKRRASPRVAQNNTGCGPG